MYCPLNDVSNEPRLEDLRLKALESRTGEGNVLATSCESAQSSGRSPNDVSRLSTSISPLSAPSTSSKGSSYYVPTRLEFVKQNNLPFSDDDESVPNEVRYPLSELAATQEEMSRLNTYRSSRRKWWKEGCDYDESSFRYVSPNPPVSVDDPYWSRKMGLETEPPFKTAEQWSQAQLANESHQIYYSSQIFVMFQRMANYIQGLWGIRECIAM